MIKKTFYIFLLLFSHLTDAQVKIKSVLVELGGNISATDCNNAMGFHLGIGVERNFKSNLNFGVIVNYDFLRGGPNEIFSTTSSNYFFNSHLIHLNLEGSYGLRFKKFDHLVFSPILSGGITYFNSRGGSKIPSEAIVNYLLFNTSQMRPVYNDQGEIIDVKNRASDFSLNLMIGGKVIYEYQQNHYIGLKLGYVASSTDLWDALDLPLPSNKSNDGMIFASIIWEKTFSQKKKYKPTTR